MLFAVLLPQLGPPMTGTRPHEVEITGEPGEVGHGPDPSAGRRATSRKRRWRAVWPLLLGVVDQRTRKAAARSPAA